MNSPCGRLSGWLALFRKRTESPAASASADDITGVRLAAAYLRSHAIALLPALAGIFTARQLFDVVARRLIPEVPWSAETHALEESVPAAAGIVCVMKG